MLCQFSFENFKSYKDEATLNFYAEPIKEHLESLIVDKADNEKFTPVAALYGPNGGGKSNVIEAMFFLFAYVLKPVWFFTSVDAKNAVAQPLFSFIDNKYHRFDDKCKNLPTNFSLNFRLNKKEYIYELSLFKTDIVKENLYTRTTGKNDAQIVFERNKSNIKLGELVKDALVGNINNSMPLLSYLGIHYKYSFIKNIIQWLFYSVFVNYSNPWQEKDLFLPHDKNKIAKMLEMIKDMGININNLRVVEDKAHNIQNVYLAHPMSNGSTKELLIHEESAGTQKIFSFLAHVMTCLEDGGIFAADELDAKMHPKLLRYIIELFTNPKTNSNGAQLILTSHDIPTMCPEVFRRDEIWFCALNSDNASHLYPLSSFKKSGGAKVRKDESYGKRYLEGKYGADPYLRKIIKWGDDDKEKKSKRK